MASVTLSAFEGRPLPVLGVDTGGVGGSQAVAGSQPGAVAGGSGGANAPTLRSGATSGPVPFNYTDAAVADTCAARLAHEHRYSSDRGWVKLKSGLWIDDKNILRPVSEICAEIGRPYRSMGQQMATIDIGLNSNAKHERVERTMRHHPTLYADKDDFDADPWLLNTPGCIIDLRNGKPIEHGALMRMQTAVTPDLTAYNDYERACPVWMHYLDFVADDRAWVIPFLQRWGGYNLVGLMLNVYFLFIHGKSGTGKTVFIDVVKRLIKTYGKSTSKQFFMRALDKRTFELSQMMKKRGVFTDETPRGATWDELMLLTMLGNTEVSAEGKGKDFQDFQTVAKVTITGNHKPKFVTSIEESGIDRRMLLLTMDKKIKEHMKDDVQFAAKVADKEGPGILMWLVQGAIEGYECLERTDSFFDEGMVDPMVDATKNYRRADNIFLQWIEEEMELDPNSDIEAKPTYTSFMGWMREQD